ncbi:uncharacterized protein LOC117321149, partial [Pecten maximus]|uniref:uncharacterized protein LOC117321149 n=1 Tax=Pecten maximus TaxID=6579 RepID=UPI001458CD8A
MSKYCSSVNMQCSGSENMKKAEKDGSTKDATKATQSQLTLIGVRCSEILTKAAQMHEIQNGTPEAKTVVVCSGAADNVTTPTSKTVKIKPKPSPISKNVKIKPKPLPISESVNIKPKTLHGQIPQSIAQTIKLASKSIPIPSKSRMIVLNSPVLLNRDALVQASLNAVMQSQGTTATGQADNQ